MKVRALTSFVGRDPETRAIIKVRRGEEFELPKWADWVSCGFCEPLEKPKRTATRAKPRVAARKKPATTSRKGGK